MVADDKGAGSQLVKALIAAKKAFKTLVKNKVNPHFKSRYADLAAVHDAVDEALAANGLTIMQPMCFDEKDRHIIKTELAHTSGETRVSYYPLPGGVKSQDLAAAITYGRRNSLCALLGIPADDDDDGESEAGRGGGSVKRESAKPKAEEKPAEAPKPAPAAGNHWVGAVVDVNSPKNGTWKVKGGDAAASEFGTATPEHAAVANDAKAKGLRVAIKFTVQASNGVKRILSIEPVKEEEVS